MRAGAVVIVAAYVVEKVILRVFSKQRPSAFITDPVPVLRDCNISMLNEGMGGGGGHVSKRLKMFWGNCHISNGGWQTVGRPCLNAPKC